MEENGEKDSEIRIEVAQPLAFLTLQMMKETTFGERKKVFTTDTEKDFGKSSWVKTLLKKDKWDKRKTLWWENGDKNFKIESKEESIKLSLKPYLK